jgi:LacI family transcriptional regulator
MNIREIAEKIGVSSATVSRVINQSGYVSEETRSKVLKAVEQYNYVPSAIARSLSIQNTSSIGVIVPDIENPFFASVIKGVTEVAEKHKYNILFFGTNETLKLEHAYLETVVRQRLNGVIITPISEDDEDTKNRLLKLKKSKIPVVLVDRDINGADFDGVFIDNFQSAYEGVTALIKEGHHRIATITGPLSTKPGSGRLAGYKKALNDNGIEIRELYILEGDFKVDRSYELTAELLNTPEPPTAIFTSNNLTTLGCLKYLTENNLVIGKDISLMGFDDIEVLKIIDYKLSVIERDAYEQGKEAMSILVKRLNENKDKYKTKRVVLPHEVILRGSEKKN